MFRTYGYTTLKATRYDNGEMAIEMYGIDGQRRRLLCWPHEARVLADLIYKVSTEGELDE